MATTQYIGARYVPLFAEPAEWDSTKQYEPLTIVLHEGNSYTSRQYVPIGIEITNEKFWALTGNYNAQVESYRRDVATLGEHVTTNTNNIATNTNNIATNTNNIATILPMDTTPTENSTKGVTSGGVFDAISTEVKQIDYRITANTNNIAATNNTLNAVVPLDDTPTNDSTKGVTSGGVFDAISTIAARKSATFNVLDYGVVGDGITDDTNALKACFEAANARYLSGADKPIPTSINLNGGTFLVSDTLTLYAGITLNCGGNCSFMTNANELTFLQITQAPFEEYSEAYANKGSIFQTYNIFTNGHCTFGLSRVNLTGTLPAVIIGSLAQIDSETMRGLCFNNCTFRNVPVGILVSQYDIFAVRIEKCEFLECNTGIQYGNTVASTKNAYENMTISHVLFIACGIGINMLAGGFGNFTLYSCSFDYCTLGIYNQYAGLNEITFFGGWIEGYGSFPTLFYPNHEGNGDFLCNNQNSEYSWLTVNFIGTYILKTKNTNNQYIAGYLINSIDAANKSSRRARITVNFNASFISQIEPTSLSEIPLVSNNCYVNIKAGLFECHGLPRNYPCFDQVSYAFTDEMVNTITKSEAVDKLTLLPTNDLYENGQSIKMHLVGQSDYFNISMPVNIQNGMYYAIVLKVSDDFVFTDKGISVNTARKNYTFIPTAQYRFGNYVVFYGFIETDGQIWDGKGTIVFNFKFKTVSTETDRTLVIECLSLIPTT